VRLVKGAYWDQETITAQANGWTSPVFQAKEETDASYERCVRLLHDHHGTVRAAFASHNLRSLAHAIAYARHLGIPDGGYELQMLYGMAEPIHAAVARLGLRLRVYGPVGELVPGMAYLVRRLLENTSNESFVRHRFAEGRDLDELLAPPRVDRLPGPTESPVVEPTDEVAPRPYRPEPLREWWRGSARAAFAVAVDRWWDADPIGVPALIAGEEVTTGQTITSVDPGAVDRRVAESVACTPSEVDPAVAAAVGAAERWRRTPHAARAGVLFRTAAWIRAHRDEIAALECFEAGKPWDQADADVCEAIDFCEYYGREIMRLDAAAASLVESPPGEANRMTYQGKGVTAVIAPWNFPLAIPTGMTAAAIAAGNPVILKPAEQTPGVAWQLARALAAAGVPRDVFQLLPGAGEQVGAALVAHRDVAAVVFTGSKAVGLEILREAAVTRPGQRHLKRVICELGGKNALVVDADADLGQAVPAVALSSFGYAGQKCSAASRLIVHDRVYDATVDRLVRCTREMALGHAATPGVEIGPVLAVLRARDFDHALELASMGDDALTAGCFSRSPAHLRRAAEELRAGNVYLNRHITGAVVGRQPFGGYGMSGIGSKAGGPDYLLQLMDPRVVTENTLRQGFAPTAGDGG